MFCLSMFSHGPTFSINKRKCAATLVLQVCVKNIPNHNNHMPFCQLRDLTAH